MQQNNRLINDELDKVALWLKANKLSLNINKTKMMVFHQPQKKLILPEIKLDNEIINCVDNFSLLGITINKHINWKPHISNISIKISRSIGILNKLKNFLPTMAKKMIYNSLISSYLNYGNLIWGHKCDRIIKLQKKAVRITVASKYNAHTDNIFMKLKILKFQDAFKLNQLKFYHKYINDKVPDYFLQMPFYKSNTIHQYNTRSKHTEYLGRVNHEFAKKNIRYSLASLLVDITDNVRSKCFTHSLNGLSQYFKKLCFNEYAEPCTILYCYICQRND